MKKLIVLPLSVMLCVSMAYGAGYGIGEFGARASAMGNAAVAQARDASTLFYNPAGIGFLEGTSFYGGVTGIFASANFVGAAPLFPNTAFDAKDQFFPPVGIYVAHKFTDRIAAGVSLTNPFGLGVEWDPSFPGRFISQDVDLKTFFISPVLAYKLADNVSVAAGLDVVLSTVNLKRNILMFNTDGVPGTGTEVGKVELDGSGDVAYGFTGSIMFKGEKIGLGLAYRHSLTTEFNDADATFNIFTGSLDPSIAAVASALFVNQKAAAAIDYPNYLAGGIYYQLTEKLGAEVAYAWYGWDRVKEIDLLFDDARLNQTIEENYKNTSQFRVGAEYAVSSKFAVRAGFIWDETPQPVEAVNPLLPDDTRLDYSVGIGYTAGNLQIDAGYMFVDIGKRSTVNDAGVGLNPEGFNGTYNSRANLAMISLGYSIK